MSLKRLGYITEANVYPKIQGNSVNIVVEVAEVENAAAILERQKVQEEMKKETEYTISSVDIEGTKIRSKEEYLKDLPVKPGDIFIPQKALDGAQKIFNSGYFAKVDPKIDRKIDNTVSIVYEVQENPIIQSINFEGNTLYKNSELEKALGVKKGEILGVAGLMGSGRTEMAKVIFGAYEKSGGKVFMEGKEVHIKNPKEAIKLGIAYLTEDRKKDGLFLNLSIEDNIMIANLNLISDKSVLNKGKSENITKKYIEKMKIKTPSKEQLTKNLSGGNQQKVILARWLCQNKKIVIFDEPTRGIDVGAKREVYNLMNELVETGAGIIMISSELPEILGMSDRVMIMHEGKIGNIIDIKDATEERILYFATGGINKYEKE